MIDCDASTALSPGVSLWIVPAPDQSAWTTRIDWYLGFQIRRALPHRRVEFSDTMRQLIEAYEENIPKVARTEETPLMIASSSLLPNHQTVLVPQADTSAWVKQSHAVWTGLSRPPTRIFLPKSISKAVFSKEWPKADADADLQIVIAP